MDKFIDVLDRTEFQKEFRGCFFTDAGYANNVIGWISAQSFKITQKFRTESVPRTDSLFVIHDRVIESFF